MGDTQNNGAEGALRQALERLDEKFAAEQVANRNAPVPDGRYNARIERVVLTRSRGGDPMLEWTLVIESEGEQKGRWVWYRRTITEKSLKWVKQELAVCGLHLERISVVADHLPRLFDARLDITIRTKEEHRNVYFNRRLDTPESGADVFEAEEDFPI